MYFHADPDNYERFVRPTKNITGIVTHTEKTPAFYHFYVSSNNNNNKKCIGSC